jgi:hypothetical protein
MDIETLAISLTAFLSSSPLRPLRFANLHNGGASVLLGNDKQEHTNFNSPLQKYSLLHFAIFSDLKFLSPTFCQSRDGERFQLFSSLS